MTNKEIKVQGVTMTAAASQGTVREFCERNLQGMATARADKIKAMGAETVIVTALRDQVTAGNMADKVGKIKQFGNEEFASFETKKYRRGTGITFTLVDGSIVKWIPGPHSWFLTDKEGR